MKNFFWFLLAIFTLFAGSCKKKESTGRAAAAKADPDVTAALEAVWATQMVSDIDLMAGFLMDRGLTLDSTFFPYGRASDGGMDSNQIVPIIDIAPKYAFLAFNKVTCFDRKNRDGTLTYGYRYGKADWYFEPGFDCLIYSNAYNIWNQNSDKWKIEIDTSTASILRTSNITAAGFDPNSTSLTWRIQGKVKFTNMSSGKSISWEGNLTKRLVNTNNKMVYDATRKTAIKWSLAVVEYKGAVKGTTTDGRDFNLVIDNNRPVIRDLTCAPELNGFHPFSNGTAVFTSAGINPRYIFFGELSITDPITCDNSGKVMTTELHDVTFLR